MLCQHLLPAGIPVASASHIVLDTLLCLCQIVVIAYSTGIHLKKVPPSCYNTSQMTAADNFIIKLTVIKSNVTFSLSLLFLVTFFFFFLILPNKIDKKEQS